MPPDLSVKISSLTMEKPTMLASGILGISIKTFKRIVDSGAGAVVTKSISVEPNEGYKAPTLVEVDGGYLNAMGLPNPGCQAFAEEMKSEDVHGVPIVVSVFGALPEEFAKVVTLFEELPVKGFELNLSCPHVERVGSELGSDPKMVYAVTSSVRKVTRRPLLVKVTPNVADVVSIARAAVEGGADGITAINTLKGMAIDVDTGRPILHHGSGGLSGPALRSVAVRCVYEITEELDVPVVGCGGVSKWEDAMEFFMAGATAVQIGTALAYSDLGLFKSVADGLSNYLAQKGFNGIHEVIGLAHRR